MPAHRRAALAAGLALLASRAAADEESDVEPSLVPPPIDPMEHQKFADDLTALMYKKDNECSSALGVSMAFSLIWPGATNNGTDEIRDTLGYPNGSNMRLVWDEVSNRMTTSYGGQCLNEWDGVCNTEAPLLEIAYSVWFHDEEDLQEEYEAVVGDYAKQIDFEADDSPVIVNEWRFYLKSGGKKVMPVLICSSLGGAELFESMEPTVTARINLCGNAYHGMVYLMGTIATYGEANRSSVNAALTSYALERDSTQQPG